MYNLGAFRYESVYMGIAAFYHAICTAPDHNTAVSRHDLSLPSGLHSPNR